LRKEYTPNKKDTETMDEGHGGAASATDEDNDSDDLVLPKSEPAAGHHTPKIFVEPLPIPTVRIQVPREHSQTEAHRMDPSPLEPGLPTDVNTLADSVFVGASTPFNSFWKRRRKRWIEITSAYAGYGSERPWPCSWQGTQRHVLRWHRTA